MNESILEELRDEQYRRAFVAAQVRTGLAFQVAALREQRGWTQGELGAKAGLQQPAISRLEGPRSSATIPTLIKLAAAFDVGLHVQFVSFGTMLDWAGKLRPGSLEVPSFSDECVGEPSLESDGYASTSNVIVGDFGRPARTEASTADNDSTEPEWVAVARHG